MLPATLAASPAAAAATPSISIGDVSVWEGDERVRTALFPVTLSQPDTIAPVTVSYTIAGIHATPGTAKTPNVDFNHKSGATRVLTFRPGVATRFIGVTIYSDTVQEPTEAFSVTLSSPSAGYTLAEAVGIGRIFDDDSADPTPPNVVAIGDALIHEGDTTRRILKFRVSLTRPATEQVTVDYTIMPLSGTFGGYTRGARPSGTDIRDFEGESRTLVFKPSVRTGLTPVQKVVTVALFPDASGWSEAFNVTLANATGPVTISDDTALGQMIDDDPLRARLWAWGENPFGGVGDGTTTSVVQPVQIGTARDWSAIAAGYVHSVAVRADGTLWAWGHNLYGQLGDGTTTNVLAPTQIGTDTDWQDVSAGGGHTLALKQDGTLWAWGHNLYGQLGDGTTTDVLAPTQIGTDTDWAEIDAGVSFTVARKSDRTLWGWGYNLYGQLGDGTTTDVLAPTQIGTDADWTNFSAGGGHTVAVKLDGTLWAWGSNMYGQLGDGTTTDRHTPTQIGTDTDWATMSDWAAVSAKYSHTAALKSDLSLRAWGQDNFMLNIGLEPSPLAELSHARSVSVGLGRMAAKTLYGSVMTWGWNQTTFPYFFDPFHIGIGGAHSLALHR